jgi:Predicted endonuclease containing a URI domain
MGGFIYILADMRRGRTYTGVTNNLVRRVHEQREGLVAGYTKSRNLKRLVYFEQFGDIGMAIQRETSLKRWYRSWKHDLIEASNPDWRDLWDDIAK